MANFRALDKDGTVLGTVEKSSTWGAIVWAQGEFRSAKPKVKFVSLEREDEGEWIFVFSTKAFGVQA